MRQRGVPLHAPDARRGERRHLRRQRFADLRLGSRPAGHHRPGADADRADPRDRASAGPSGLPIDDIGAFEVNKAFAPVPLAETGADGRTLDPNGGAIARGHPRGASCARLMTTLIHHMLANGIR